MPLPYMYNKNIDIYHYNDDKIRYVLGKNCDNPLLVLGINPSYATPVVSDPTICKVSNIANFNGFNGYIMLNVYPERQTDFSKLSQEKDIKICNENISAIRKLVDAIDNVNIWCAWGNHIYDRNYLIPCLKDIYESIKDKNINWLCSKRNKDGTPRHPLYQNKETKLFNFDIENYLKQHQ